MTYECQFDSMCSEEFATMDEKDDHERNGHKWDEERWECCGQPVWQQHCQECEDMIPGSGCHCDGRH